MDYNLHTKQYQQHDIHTTTHIKTEVTHYTPNSTYCVQQYAPFHLMHKVNLAALQSVLSNLKQTMGFRMSVSRVLQPARFPQLSSLSLASTDFSAFTYRSLQVTPARLL